MIMRNWSIVVLTILLMLFPCSFQSHSQRESGVEDSFSSREINCGVALGKGLKNSLNFGLNYEVLQRFGRVHGCDVDIHAIADSIDLCEMLREGKLDLAVLLPSDTAAVAGIHKHISPDGSFIWASVEKNRDKCLLIDNWLAYASGEDGDLMQMRQMFSSPYNPARRAAAGIKSRYISPYDNLIKEYAKQIGWDWKMLAALIYTESKFTINNVSPRGAVGLMQVMPHTARKFEAGDLMDPEENIKAGTAYIAAIQDKYLNDPAFRQEEREKLVLASFNAGVGRITECRRICSELGLDNKVWSNVEEAMPLCSNFKGSETRAYVNKVLSVYDAFCTICPY